MNNFIIDSEIESEIINKNSFKRIKNENNKYIIRKIYGILSFIIIYFFVFIYYLYTTFQILLKDKDNEIIYLNEQLKLIHLFINRDKKLNKKAKNFTNSSDVISTEKSFLYDNYFYLYNNMFHLKKWII